MYDLFQIIRLTPFQGGLIDRRLTAFQAAVADLVAFFGVECNPNRRHQSTAVIPAVSRKLIDVLGVQANWAVIPVTAAGYRLHSSAAVLTDKPAVFCRSAHGSIPARSITARINPTNSGCGRFGRDRNSG